LGHEAGKLEFRLGVIDNQNIDKELAHVAFSPDEGVVLAMLSKDKKQGKLGWKALCVKQMEE